MTSARRIAAAWNRFWFAERDGLPLGLIRIGFAIASLCFWAGMIPWLRLYYSDAGEFPIERARVWGSEWFGRFLMPDVMGALPPVVLLAALWGLALLALLVGWHTRAAALLCWALTQWFHHRNPTFLNGGDELLRLSSLYIAVTFLAVPPAERAVSLDRRHALGAGRALGDGSGATVIPSWPIRMFQLQLMALYLVSGFWKVIDPSWQDGTALWVALASPTFTRFGVPGAPQWLFAAATMVVAWWELLFVALVWVPRARRAALLVGVAVHLFILVFMNVGVFPIAMLALYPAFLTPEECRSLIRPFAGWSARVSDQPGATSSRSTGAASAALP